jgi:hypothetical protein
MIYKDVLLSHSFALVSFDFCNLLLNLYQQLNKVVCFVKSKNRRDKNLFLTQAEQQIDGPIFRENDTLRTLIPTVVISWLYILLK